MATLIVLSTPRTGGGDALISYVDQVIPLIIDAGGTPIKRLHVSGVVWSPTLRAPVVHLAGGPCR